MGGGGDGVRRQPCIKKRKNVGSGIRGDTVCFMMMRVRNEIGFAHVCTRDGFIQYHVTCLQILKQIEHKLPSPSKI